ncbi:MAG: MCE family protein [Bacteroidetes bacterium]|nr:MAG: MCE family protein [Bacteroidota bacterium]
MKYSKYVKLGLLVVITLVILFWGLSYLKGNDVFKRSSYYYVVYERIDGLLEANKVTMNGYQIGQVQDISFAPERTGNLIVKLMIDSEFKIPVNSLAQIVSSDIMGTRSIRMILSDESTYYQTNDTIPGAIESDLKEQVSLQVLPIKNKAEQLLSTIDSAITVLTVIFNEDARENLSESFENINRTIENAQLITSDLQQIVSAEKGNIQQILVNIEDITSFLSSNTAELEKTIKNLSSFSDTLSQISVSPIITNIADASNQILNLLEKINSDESTAGLLLNDDQLYLSITALSDNLGFLIKDIQTNPKRYVQFSAVDFGKEYYINTSGDVSSKNIVFKVHLISSETKIPSNSKLFEGLGEVEEYYANEAYSYLLGATSSYSEIIEVQNQARKKFPESAIVAFKNGQLIKLEKALKSLK